MIHPIDIAGISAVAVCVLVVGRRERAVRRTARGASRQLRVTLTDRDPARPVEVFDQDAAA